MEVNKSTGKEFALAEKTSLEDIGKIDPITTVGFTPKLGWLLSELKVALANNFKESPIKFLEITFHPDPEYQTPLLLRTEFEDNVKVTLRVVPPKRGSLISGTERRPGSACLEVGTEGSEGTLSLVSLKNLQDFVEQLAQGKSVKLGWAPVPVVTSPVDEPVLVDFLTLTQPEYNVLPPRVYSLIIEGQPEPMFMVGAQTLNWTKDVACLLSKFRFYGSGQEIERALELLPGLLDYKNSVSAPHGSESQTH